MSKGTGRVRVMLRRDVIDALAKPLGLKTISDKARFVGIREPVFNRIYNGERGAGGPNVRRIVNAPWPKPVTVDDLFVEVVAA
jgi:hypothetical protein